MLRSALAAVALPRWSSLPLAATTSPSRWASNRGAPRVRSFDPAGTVWAEFTPLAVSVGAVNLGQGFPNTPLSDVITNAVKTAVSESVLNNQYCPVQGHPRLVQALASHYNDSLKTVLKPQNILVTPGATNGIYSAMAGHVSPGDEVIIVEPYYDSYGPAVTLAGGTPKFVPLRLTGRTSTAADWTLDVSELKKAFSEKTKMLVINTPHNPTGKVFTRDELSEIAKVVSAHPSVMVLSDEVYSELVYSSGPPHVPFASLPGMFERTITLGSAGKSFSVTGWKVGWALGPVDLIQPMWLITQYSHFCVSTPLQVALAKIFEYADSGSGFFESQIGELERKRDFLYKALIDAGIPSIKPQGAYFILSDTSAVPDDAPLLSNGVTPVVARPPDSRRDYRIARWLTTQVGVAAIPPSAFYSKPSEEAGRLVRFCYCKTDEELSLAAQRFANLRDELNEQRSASTAAAALLQVAYTRQQALKNGTASPRPNEDIAKVVSEARKALKP